MSDCEKIENCLLCDGKLELILSLGDSPLANEFLDEPNSNQDKFPLNLTQCQKCGHCQLDCLVSEERMFRHYHYVSGTSPINKLHFEEYANSIMERFFPHINNEKLEFPQNMAGYEDFLIDIGSNDGTFLQSFNNKIRRIGIDPATNIAKIANDNNIYTIPEFFNEETAINQIINFLKKSQNPPYKAKIITANNIFAHNKNLQTIVNGINLLLDDEGTFIIENSYLLDMVNSGIFDVIYSEHIHYHNITSLDIFFRKLGMYIYDVQHQPNHGGSFRAFICKDGAFKPMESVQIFKNNEKQLYMKLIQFREKIMELKNKLWDEIYKITQNNNTIGIYGFPAKATTLMYFFGFRFENKFNKTQYINSIFEYVVDDAKIKQEKYIPGGAFQVLDPKVIYEKTSKYILILSWNFAQDIIRTHRKFVDEFNGEFIIPLPNLLKINRSNINEYLS